MATSDRVLRRMLLVALVALGMGSCMTFRMSDRELTRRMPHDGAFAIRRTTIDDRPIRYVESGTDTGVLILFIHGAPGSLDDFIDYVADPALQVLGRLVSYDRPGYGYSDFGRPLTSMAEHAKVARLFAESVRRPGERLVVVGHSYGGTVALQMAVDYPGFADRYLLLAASMSSDDEPYFWFNRPVSWRAVNWAVPRAWRVANAEKMAQRDNLRRLDERLGRIADPVLVVHGDEDQLIPVSHAEFIASRASDPPVTVQILEGEGHLLIWRSYETVRDLVRSVIPSV